MSETAEKHFTGAPATLSHGQEVLHVERNDYVRVITALKHAGYNVCVDVTSVDYLDAPERAEAPGVVLQRFEVIANLLSHSMHKRVRVRVQIPENDTTLPSLYDLYPGVEAMEREVYDLMGIVFSGHPDLTRILMPEDWEGHPLRKDYAMGNIPVQFKYPEGVYDEASTQRGSLKPPSKAEKH